MINIVFYFVKNGNEKSFFKTKERVISFCKWRFDRTLTLENLDNYYEFKHNKDTIIITREYFS